MDVGDVLRDRVPEPSGFEWMAGASLLAHVVFGLALFFAPGHLLPSSVREPPTVMTITLDGGNGGPNNGGISAIGGRAVQEVRPPDAVKRPEAVRPPAAKTPEMIVPAVTKAPVKATPTPAPVVSTAPDDARGRTPVKGTEVREGSAFAETGARGLGFGLSSGGGQGSGSRLDVADFCCPDYIILMVERVRSNWVPKAEVAGLTVVKFTIQRDGAITGAEVERSSGYTALDIAALRAIVGARQLTPLPAGYPNPSLGVHLNFEYKR